MGSPYQSPEQPQGHLPSAGAASSYAGYSSGLDAQQIIDTEHLKLLRIGYFISAGQTALVVPFGLLYAGMGVVFSHLPTPRGAAPPPAMFTLIFGIIGSAVAVLGGIMASLKLLTAMRLKDRRSRVLCLITAALSCLEIPYGTALGVMTFVVLGRASVRRLFDD